jgi:hypothetical protein
MAQVIECLPIKCFKSEALNSNTSTIKKKKKILFKPGTVAHFYNPSSWEAGQEDCEFKTRMNYIYSKVQASLGYIVRPCPLIRPGQMDSTSLDICPSTLGLHQPLGIPHHALLYTLPGVQLTHAVVYFDHLLFYC